MDTFGSRLRQLRQAHQLTQKQLAAKIGCSEKMIVEYEKDRYQPSAFILTNSSICFDVSTDYLLGLTTEGGGRKKQQEFVRMIERVIANQPEESADYYWLSFERDSSGRLISYGGQTQWVGFTPDGKHELRALRPVKPEAAVALCTETDGAPMVVNSEKDLEIFLQFGGESIAKAELIQRCLPFLLEPFPVERSWESRYLEELLSQRQGGSV